MAVIINVCCSIPCCQISKGTPGEGWLQADKGKIDLRLELVTYTYLVMPRLRIPSIPL